MRAYEFVLFESFEGKKQHILDTQANSIFKKAQSDPVLSNDIRSLREKNIDEAEIKKTIALAVIDQAAETDPTEDIQKKYMLWIIRQFTKNGLRFEEMPSIKPDLEYYHSLTPQQRDADRISRDINTYNYTTLHDAIAESQNTADDQFKPEPLNYEHIKSMDVLYHDRLGQLIVPESYEASCELGSGTKWCTASRESREGFDDYNEQGPLYVWIPSLSKQVQRDRSISRKFQFHFQSGHMTDEADRQLKPDEIDYFRTGHPVLSELFTQQEAIIATDARSAYDYARFTIKGRWPRGEPAIAENTEYACLYARDVIKGRWPEAEETIAENAESAYRYAEDVIKGRWPRGEPAIAENAEHAYYYAKDVIKGRWPRGEPAIAENAEHAHYYAVYVINGRWPRGEPAIAKNAAYAYLYAKDVIEGRWTDPKSGIDEETAKEAEKTIVQNTLFAQVYAKDVIKDRWPEAEPAIARSNSYIKDQYADFLVRKGYIKNIEDFQ